MTASTIFWSRQSGNTAVQTSGIGALPFVGNPGNLRFELRSLFPTRGFDATPALAEAIPVGAFPAQLRLPKGTHFATGEQPAIFVSEMGATFKSLRSS
jgi:hypothetical protein